jgi:hypothetical protein
MSINYSAIVNSKQKVTLPSVEAWGADFQILRDPPKSIMTRRVDKVGEGSGITQMIDDAGDRACEAILEYARGVNPMVSVSYSNNDGTPTKNPYSINRDGAFRPPVMSARDLMPLSRQPRNWTTAFSMPGFADFSKRLHDCGQMTDKNTREVKSCTIKTSCRPTAVFQLETPISEPFEVKYNIQNPVKASVTSGLKSMDYTTQNVIEPVKGIDYNMMHAYAQSNLNANKYINESEFDSGRYIQHNLNTNAVSNVSNPSVYVNETEFDPDRYIQDNLNINAASNPSLSHIQVTSIDDIIDMAPIRTQDTLHSKYTTPIQGLQQNNIYDHNDIELYRNLPEHYANTNINQNIHKAAEYDNTLQFQRKMPIAVVKSNPGTRERNLNDEINSRDYKLAPKVNAGGFDGRGNAPTIERQTNMYNLNSGKSTMSKKIGESFENRYQSIAPRA